MAYSDEVLADSPVAYWKLDETSGTTVTDSSGNGRDGTYAGSPTLNQTSADVKLGANKCVSFDGSNDKATIADNSVFSMNNTNLFTVECWVNVTGAANKWILFKGASAALEWQLEWDHSNTRFLWRTNTAVGEGSCYTKYGTAGKSTGVWYHVVVTCDGAPGSTLPKMYVDGVLQVGDQAGSGGLYVNGVGAFTIAQHSANGNYINAKIDEVAIYNTALSAARILDHYNAGTTSPHATVSPPVASLTFTALAPTVTAFTDANVTVDNAPTLAFEALAPDVTADANVTVDNVPDITWTALDPDVTAGAAGEVFVANVPSITFEALAPTVTAEANVTVTVDNVPDIAFSASAPTVETLVSVDNVPTVTWTALAPDVTVDVIVTVDGAPTVTWTALEPSFAGSDASVAYRNAVLADAPYLYYRLEETSGTVAIDSSGNARHGTYSGSPALATTAGKFANSYGIDFNTDSKKITYSPTRTFPNTASYSIEAWTKPTSSLTMAINVGNANCKFSLTQAEVRGLQSNGTFVGSTTNTIPTLTAGEWVHVVLTCSSTVHRVYINGVARASCSPTSPHTLYGWEPQTSDFVLPGSSTPNRAFDEIAIYSHTLSAARIADHYNASTAPVSVAVSAPLLGTITFEAQEPTVVGGTDVEIKEIANTPVASFAAFIPNLLINDGPFIFSDPLVMTWSMPVPAVSVVSNILIESDLAGMNYQMFTPTIFIGDIAFRFIGEDYTGFTAADADYLTSLHFGPIIHGQTRVARFRIGNTSSSRTNITAYATSVNNLAEMATFSTDGVNFDEAVVIGIEPNGVSDVIWLKLAVTTSAYVDNGTFLIQLENV